MIGFDVLCLGLTRLQFHTLRCHFPCGFSFYDVTPDNLSSDEDVELFVSKAWCAFINPKKLQPGQLSDIIKAHKYATEHTHAAILLFTEAFTKEQKETVDTKSLIRVDLRAGLDKPLRDVIQIIRKASMPCWDGMARMRSNMLNDGWYLIDMESTGIDPLEDEVISLTVSFMADYKILKTETLYIKPSYPISKRIEELTGITNEQLACGITKEEAVKYLMELPSPSPLIFERFSYFVPFIQALFGKCGEKFDIPYIAVDGLIAITRGYTLARRIEQMVASIESRKHERTPVDNQYIAKLYDVTLALFEDLQDRYGVRSAGDFHSLYYGKIEYGE